MHSVGSAVFHSGFVAILVAGGLSLACVSNDDPDDKGSAGSSSTAGSGGSGTTGTGGGGTGGGGTGGMITAPACATVAKLSGTSPTIVDFEAMKAPSDNYTYESAGLPGGTYIYTDNMAPAADPSTSMLSLGPGHTAESTQALVGKIHNATWGGGLGLWLACMDASAYTGITLWARGASPAGAVRITLAVNRVEKVSKGGECPDAGPCDGPFAALAVTDQWQQFTFKWADFSDGNAGGTPVPPTVEKLFGIGFNLPNNNMSRDLELAIDDVSFTTK